MSIVDRINRRIVASLNGSMPRFVVEREAIRVIDPKGDDRQLPLA